MGQVGFEPIRIDAPPLVRLPGLLDVITPIEGSGHELEAGVTFESDAVTRNGEVTYADADDLTSEDKAKLEELALVTGFGWTSFRREWLPIPAAGGLDEQEARARRHFEMWESTDVEAHIAAHFDTAATNVAIAGLDPEEGFAALLTSFTDDWPGIPFLLSPRGPGVSLARRGSVEDSGGTLVLGSGYTNDDRLYITPELRIYRGEVIVGQYADVANNRIDTLIERNYFVIYDGPAYRIDVEYAPEGGS